MSTSTAAISRCFRYRSLILSHLNRCSISTVNSISEQQQHLKLRSLETRIPNQPIFGIQNDVAIGNQMNLAALIDGNQLPLFARGRPVKIDDEEEEDVEAFDEDSDEFESEDEDEFDEMDGEDEVDDDEDEDPVYKKRN